MGLLAFLLLGLVDPDIEAEARARAMLPASVARHVGDTPVRWRAEARPEGFGIGEAEVVAGSGVQVYRLPPGGGARPGAAERAVVFSLVHAADAAAGWSADARWRAAGRWVLPGASPNLALSAARGASARAELAAAVADLLVPPGDPDTTLDCRDPPRAALVRTLLEMPVFSGTCPAFEAWARLESLAFVEVDLAAPSGVTLASLFGHFFLRLVYDDGQGRQPTTRSVAVAWLAESGFTDDLFYSVRGLLGAYRVTLALLPFEQVYQDYVITEARDIHRWRLVLTAAERRRLMEHLWAARSQAWRYLFFTRNCASLLMNLLTDALGPDLPMHPGVLGKSPGAALDALQRARTPDGQPRLMPLEPAFLGRHTVARQAEAWRRGVEGALVEARPALAPLFEQARAADPRRRQAAYEAASVQLTDGRGADWLRASLRVELALVPTGHTTPALEALQRGLTDLRTTLGGLPAAQPPPSVAAADPWPHPGLDQLHLGAFVGDGQGLRLGLVGFEERLGDHRRHGIGGETELVLLHGTFDLQLPQAELRQTTTRLFGYRSIRERLPGEPGLPGWSTHLDLGSRDASKVFGITGETALLFPLLRSAGAAHHLILGVGLAPGLQRASAWRAGGAVPGTLAARLGQGHHALELTARFAPAFDADGWHATHHVGVRVRAGLWPDFWGRGIRLVLGAEHTGPSPVGVPEKTGALASVGLEVD